VWPAPLREAHLEIGGSSTRGRRTTVLDAVIDDLVVSRSAAAPGEARSGTTLIQLDFERDLPDDGRARLALPR
jgi:hypothetical protein